MKIRFINKKMQAKLEELGRAFDDNEETGKEFFDDCDENMIANLPENFELDFTGMGGGLQIIVYKKYGICVAIACINDNTEWHIFDAEKRINEILDDKINFDKKMKKLSVIAVKERAWDDHTWIDSFNFPDLFFYLNGFEILDLDAFKVLTDEEIEILIEDAKG